MPKQIRYGSGRREPFVMLTLSRARFMPLLLSLQCDTDATGTRLVHFAIFVSYVMSSRVIITKAKV